MSYLNGPFRPPWFRPVAIGWYLTGLPVAIIVPIFWAMGVSPTEEPPPPPTELGSMVFSAVTQLVAVGWTFGTPIILLLVDRRYRRLIRQSELTNNARD